MIRRASPRHHRRPRRGAVLLVVLGLLALFAVVGLGFVLLAESEATGARNYRASRNEVADPDPEGAANQALAQLLFGTADTGSALWGHDLARSRFGPAGTQSPYTGTGVPPETDQATGNVIPLSLTTTLGPASLDRRQVVHFAVRAGWTSVSPDFANVGQPNQVAINKAVPWTYPDRNNFWLAYYDPTTDTVTVPSFHRPDLFGVLTPTGQPGANPNWTNAEGFYKSLRPRPAEHPAFHYPPANADGSYTGDVCNLKWLTGSARNDSLWLDPNLPVKEWRGKRYKTLVAPLILDLSGKVNLSVAGNNRNAGGHGSHHGWGAWEVNPTGLLNYPANVGNNPADATAITQFQAHMNLRYTGANPVGALQPLDRFRLASTGTLNRGLMTPQYSRIDAVGASTGVPDPMTFPVGGTSPFPTYSGRFAANQVGLDAQLIAPHGQSFNPWQWNRRQSPTSGIPWLPTLEDQLRLTLPTRMTRGLSALASQTPTPIQPNPRLTTHFSVSQRWGEVTVPTGPGTTARLAAIDLTRPLPDYRGANTAAPLSPQNLGGLVNARVGRQNLARDIFARLAAVSGLIDGTNAAYTPATGYLTIGAGANATYLRFLAQVAANMVDQIDNDDVATQFVWNPADPTQADVNGDVNNFNVAAALPNRVVYGTELPKLVLSEAYCALTATGRDSPPFGPPVGKGMGVGVQRPQDGAHKAYWLELHNPLPAVDPTLSDGGAARLEYDPAVTPGYAGGRYAAYEIEVADVSGPNALAYSEYLATSPLAYVGDTPARTNAGTTMTPRLQVRDYTHYNGLGAGMGPAVPMAQPADDTQKYVAPGGYFVTGPRADFPTPGVVPNLRVADPPGMPMAGAVLNALSFDTNARTGGEINTQLATTSVVLLRRLVNPYLPPQTDATQPNYNPYMTVDYLENVPTRDRVAFDNNGPRGGMAGTDARPTVGRKHPYAAAPAYNPAAMAAPLPAVVDQVNAAVMNNPPHTLGAVNSPLDNAAGLAWLAHLDREPTNALELLATSVFSADQLTQKFYTGAAYQGHLIPTGATVPFWLDATLYPNAHRALDLLGTANRLPGVPLGGREPGRVNLNTAGQDAVLQAVLDPQSGNLFSAGYPAAIWNTTGVGLLPSRTPNPAGTFNQPAATVGEGGTDRPFQPGGALFADSLFRAAAANPTSPLLFNYGAGTTHPHVLSEPLRKGWNNLTTVSDGFLVVFTVGFFEVDTAGRLGRELSDTVTGDLRAQFAGVVDRTAITQNLDAATLAVQTTVLGPKPWETKLTADSLPGMNTLTLQATGTVGGNTCVVYDDGTPVTIQANSALWVGYSSAAAGGDGEAVRVTTVTPNGNGTATLTLAAPLTRFHGGGTRVSNAPVGHPGPQGTFDYRDTTGRYRGVLPYFMRIVP